MDDLNLHPEFTPAHYVLLLLLLIFASAGSSLFAWIMPHAAHSLWLDVLPPLLGLYSLMLFFKGLGIIRLPSAAVYSAILTPITLVSFYQFLL
ncbi:hypothetical protein SAMN06297280_0627 [Arsukibacterium tuosuense]|uniref:Uncharacterized protein n=1 Tax=Arsukibacterium tuosuense TaxID=1323745 RepID=A0A285I721_9GAMM|nr:hypothetical protein [Arsukibacterium tuosuense]SNY43683.1 hypothetical protein SAMN06297280_0627 [Arsukibacterium tuosuense]